MTHTYHITGITCSNCVQTIQKALSQVKGITAVRVNQEKQEAELDMSAHVATGELQKALSGTKFTITDASAHHTMPAVAAADEPITWKTYLPVFLIFGYILGTTLLVQAVQGRFDFMEWMRHFMAGFFLTFSFFKMLDIPAFAISYSSYDIVARRWLGYGYIYPFIELGLGIAFLIPSLTHAANVATFAVMSVSIIGVIQSMLRKSQFQCACLGAVFKLPIGKITFMEDALMIVMSAAGIVMMIAGR